MIFKKENNVEIQKIFLSSINRFEKYADKISAFLVQCLLSDGFIKIQHTVASLLESQIYSKGINSIKNKEHRETIPLIIEELQKQKRRNHINQRVQESRERAAERRKKLGLPVDKKVEISSKQINVKGKFEELIKKRNESYSLILKILLKVSENTTLMLQRCAELAETNLNITKEIIKEVLEEKPELGEYKELELVFMKSTGSNKIINELITNPLPAFRYYTCFYCGNSLDKSMETCSDCNRKIILCSVCKLIINFGEDAGKCSLCESHAHIDHLQEWLKTQGKCPTCMQKLPLEGIVPITAVKAKK